MSEPEGARFTVSVEVSGRVTWKQVTATVALILVLGSNLALILA
jgi:hypothetical protein